MGTQQARLRSLSQSPTERLAALRKIARLLDSAFIVPGTSYRFGLDPILGFIPGLGDLVSPLFALGILWQARDLGIPRVVQLRMIFNCAIDALVGAAPIVGDLFDFAWKANDKNLALLETHAREHRAPSAGDWVFVAIMAVLVLVIAAVPFVIVAWVMARFARVFS